MSSPNLKRKAAAATASPKSKKSRAITSFFAPTPSSIPTAPSSAANAAPSPKWNKQKWAASLTPEQRKLLKLEIDTMHDSWLAVLRDELVSDQFLSLKRFLAEESGEVFPPSQDVYSWSRHTPLDSVKVVILGQDPYHGPRQAMGLSFSVRPPTPAPPSLQNIYKALANDYPTFTPPPARGGCLVPWANRGVLLLNACLTVRAGAPNSHANRGWERLTGKALEAVATAKRRTGGVVFMAWGAEAAKRVAGLDTKAHLVLRSVHPSPLSARRGFFDCGHFKKANEWLQTKYGDRGPIDWSLHGDVPVGAKAGQKILDERKKKEEDEFEAGSSDEEAMVLAAMEVEAKEQEKGKGKGKGKVVEKEERDEFGADSDEEEMIRAAEEAEKQLASSPVAPKAMAKEAPSSPLAPKGKGNETAAASSPLKGAGSDEDEVKHSFAFGPHGEPVTWSSQPEKFGEEEDEGEETEKDERYENEG